MYTRKGVPSYILSGNDLSLVKQLSLEIALVVVLMLASSTGCGSGAVGSCGSCASLVLRLALVMASKDSRDLLAQVSERRSVVVLVLSAPSSGCGGSITSGGVVGASLLLLLTLVTVFC